MGRLLGVNKQCTIIPDYFYWSEKQKGFHRTWTEMWTWFSSTFENFRKIVRHPKYHLQKMMHQTWLLLIICNFYSVLPIHSSFYYYFFCQYTQIIILITSMNPCSVASEKQYSSLSDCQIEYKLHRSIL